jgi:hypothetical protein
MLLSSSLQNLIEACSTRVDCHSQFQDAHSALTTWLLAQNEGLTAAATPTGDRETLAEKSAKVDAMIRQTLNG